MHSNLDNLNDQKKNSPTLHLLKKQHGSGGAHGESVVGEGDGTASSPDNGSGGEPLPAEATVSGEVLEGDPLWDVAQEIETIDDPETAEQKAKEYLDEGGFAYFKLGGVLTRIEENDWKGNHETFRDYVESAIGVGYHKARRLIAIYTGLLEMGVPWEKLAPIGWSKTILLLDVMDAKNADGWIAKAISMTYLQLGEDIKAYKKSQESGQPETPTTVSTKTFKLHADQKASVEAALDKAKQEAPTEYDSVALEHLCQTYLSPGASKPKEPKGVALQALEPGAPGYKWPTVSQVFGQVNEQSEDLDEAMKTVFAAFEIVWPSVDVTVKVNPEGEKKQAG